MTREAVDAFGPGVKCNVLAPTEVKGKTGKLEVFELIGIE
jgi:hypothetical protein